jgi:hypothetical protein
VDCPHCATWTTARVCVNCRRDLPPGWEDAATFSLAVTGARGAGKGVYLAVMLHFLTEYAAGQSLTVQVANEVTRDVFERQYWKPLFEQNIILDGTPPLSAGHNAYQKDPLMFRISGGAGGDLFLVLRDCAGEELEDVNGPEATFSYFDRADLVVFLFDSLRLPSMENILSGLIPDSDKGRLGKSAGEVLPKVLAQMSSGHADLALTFSKFDAFHELPRAQNSRYAAIMGNPAAHFNRDETFYRAELYGDTAAQRAAFIEDLAFLDAEVRSLFDANNEKTVTNQADQAVTTGRVRSMRHFAVSSVGESPQHARKLTERGISPFRVLDPILWGLESRGYWI